MASRGRIGPAVILAATCLLTAVPDAYPADTAEARRKYTVACQRLSELKKSERRKKYRSSWTECARIFESVEKKYPSSPAAADACFERAGLFADLYRTARNRRDLAESLKLSSQCQAAYPLHQRAPEALYRIVILSLEFKKDKPAATVVCEKLSSSYPGSPWTGKARARLGIPEPGKKQDLAFRPPPKNAPFPLGTVKEIRHWSGGAYTRIVIDIDQPFTFEAKELKNPDRLFFDLKKARVADSLDKDPLPINDGILKQVRASQYAPDTVRVVLDLGSLKSYAAFPLHDPDRLVIDVTGEAGEAPAEPPKQQPESGDKPGQQARNEAPAPSTSVNSGSGEKLSLSRQLGLKVKTIAIDAGHGGHDPGAIGKYKLREKEVTLDIARRLAKLVKERLDCTVIMTRDRDVFVPLDKRPFIAKSGGADLFVSIHTNANRKRAVRGIETYIQGINASDRDAMATAARENATTTKKLSELNSEIYRFLKDLADDSKSDDSLHLAHTVQVSLVNNLKPLNRHAVDLKPIPKRAFFYVLINTEMPSILAEVGFISNPDEEKLLRQPAYRQKVAEALFQGIKKYMEARGPQMAGI